MGGLRFIYTYCAIQAAGLKISKSLMLDPKRQVRRKVYKISYKI